MKWLSVEQYINFYSGNSRQEYLLKIRANKIDSFSLTTKVGIKVEFCNDIDATTNPTQVKKIEFQQGKK